MWLLGVQGLYEWFGGCFKEAGLRDDLIEILKYTNEALIIVEGYGGGLHPLLLRTLVLENLERMDDFAKIFEKYIGESTMKTLCKELKELLEVVEDE